MANRLLRSMKNLHLLALHNLKNLNNHAAAVSTNHIRYLYSKSTLGLESFAVQRGKTQRQLQNISDKFRKKMEEYSQDDSKNMIFTEDLKNMIHLSESDDDVELVVKMVKRFNQQNKQLRFGNFVFGPVIMRLFYICNKADLAFECFKMPEMSGFFDQLMSYQILLDLLYENKKYDQMLEIVDIIIGKQMEGFKYPRNIVVLAMAACYKLNTKESLAYALKLWQDLKDVGHYPMRRATTFCAGLALNQGQPAIAMEIITLAKNQSYTTIRNLKVAALVQLGRVDDAIPVLKSVIAEDNPENTTTHTFNKDVLENVKDAVAKLDNPDIALEFNRIQEIFQKQGQINNLTLDEQLCLEIQLPSITNSRQKNQEPRMVRSRERRQPNASYTYHQRPGLNELM